MRIQIKDPVQLEPASLHDILRAIDGNRSRIRTLAGMILSVCGMLLSASFVILFFILKEHLSIYPFVPALLFGTAVLLLEAAMLSVLSALPPRPVKIYGKLDLVDALMNLYQREYRRAVSSAVCLFLGLASFVFALGIFAWASTRH